MIRLRGRVGNRDTVTLSCCGIEESPSRGPRGLFPGVGQPGSGVAPAKNRCGWHGEDQETLRRDGRGEDCVLELSRSHPVGVICGKARERAQARLPAPRRQKAPPTVAVQLWRRRRVEERSFTRCGGFRLTEEGKSTGKIAYATKTARTLGA